MATARLLALGFGRAPLLSALWWTALGEVETISQERRVGTERARAMLAHDRLAPVTLLKIGHHGSCTSTTQEFLRAAAP